MNPPAFIRIILACGLLFGFLAGHAADSTQEGERLFTLKVIQIFSSKCFSCHGGDPDKIKGELDLTTRRGLLNR